ncbi:MAG: two-component regulator propeller domain-containing protein, partial [Bacteroidota bacterium]
MLCEKSWRVAIKTTLILLLALQGNLLSAQSPSFNFHQLGSANGLSDPAIKSITQDKYGYIWIGTVNGLNRFNGYEVKVFQHILNDSFSLQENYVPALLADDAGNLWVAQPRGLYRYDYNSNHFMLFPGSNELYITKMIMGGKSEIYLSTNEGLILFNTSKGTFVRLKDNNDVLSKKLLSVTFNDFCLAGNGIICLATDSGLVKYNSANHRAEMIATPAITDQSFGKIAIDGAKNIWLSYGDKKPVLVKIAPDFLKQTVYPQFYVSNSNLRDNRITCIFSDNKGRLWVCAARNGLCLYDALTDKFMQYEHDPLQASSLTDNLINIAYQDRQGLIWVGTEVTGVNYFDADKTLFHIIQPSYNQSPTLPDYWCRAAGEDSDGNLWLGTGSGIARYDPQKNVYTIFQNTADKMDAVHYNSIRSVLCDGDVVWIGTASGLNRYHRSTGKMDFLGEKEHLPLSFFWSIFKDHQNNVWFGCRDGFYRYNNITHKIDDFTNDPQLGKYARYNTLNVYEDSRKRMWFCFHAKGLLMYDAANSKTKYWTKNNAVPGSLSNNHVISIVEDKTNVMWIATQEGLNAWDEKKGSFSHYLLGPGKVSETIAALQVDDKNRLWFAGSKSLYMLDTSRNFFTPFDISNGLPTVDFNYQSAFRMKNGDFIYPTLRGFVQFNPDKYSNKNNISDAYISSFTVYGKEPVTHINFEGKKEISLAASENFFSLDMI